MRRLAARTAKLFAAHSRMLQGDQPIRKASRELPKVEAGVAKPEMTVGLDLGDRYSHYCLFNSDGEVVEEGRVQSTEDALRRHFEGEDCLRIALECGAHSTWVSRLLNALGHLVIVANAGKISAITGSESKKDRNDAEKLARFAAFDPKLLSPLEHRSEERQVDLNLIHARSTLGRARTMIVSALRCLVKSAGGRLPAYSTESFPALALAAIPPALSAVATPLVEQIVLLNAQVDGMDKEIETLSAKYPRDRSAAHRTRRGTDRCRRVCADAGLARCGQQPIPSRGFQSKWQAPINLVSG